MTAHPSGLVASRLRPALDAPCDYITTEAGEIALYADGAGPPVLLVHSVNAAASSYEVKPIFDELRRTHRVHAMDLPGFGRSQRDAGPYSVTRFTDAIEDVADEISRRNGGRCVDIVALSLSGEFVARISRAGNAAIGKLALVTPTGFQTGASKLRGPAGATLGMRPLEWGLTLPILSDALYAGLVSRRSIVFFLRRTFGRKDVDQGLIDYCVETAHQPQAKHAVFAFASGKLFSADIRTVHESLTCPVWLAHGTRGAFSDYRDSGWVHDRPNWSVTAYGTGAFPHFEQNEPFMRQLRAFLEHGSVR